jgi:rod shape-determining protein MreD
MALARFSPANPAKPQKLWPILILGLFFIVLTGWPWAGLYLVGWRPDWLLILTLYLCLRAESYVAYLGAFIFGFFQSYISLAPPGAFSLKLMVGVLITRLLIRKLELGRTSPKIFLVLGLHLGLNAGFEPYLLNLVQPQLRYQFLSEQTLILTTRTGLVTALFIGPLFGILDYFIRPKDNP